MEEDPDDTAWLEAEELMEQDPVTVSLGPMGSLFQQLRSAFSWQYRRLKGVKIETQILGQGLERLCTDLKDLSESEDTITRCWMRQVRDLCYDTSDYLDELMYFIHYSCDTRRTTRLFLKNRLESKNSSKKKKIFRVSRRPACNQLRLSLTKVNKLKRVPLIAKLSALVARVEDADERRRRFKFSPPEASKHDHTQVTGASYLMPKLPLELHVDNLMKMLGFDNDQDERNLKLATVFGSADGGKTAVARTLYHKFRERFQYRAFLRVSRDPDVRRLLADLLSQIKAPSAHAFFDVEGLIATITKHLQGKRYLIVIDDLWDTSTWDIISRALPHGDYCRIITTTQIEDVALACCSDQLKHIYEITPLNDDQSGVPEGGFTTYPSTEGMKEALNLVYNNLPPHLKACLLYLNIYPEGWNIKKDELVKQWVAEGFISSVHGQDAEVTAGCYFDALVSTGMVQSVDRNYNDEVLSCTLHHMVLDLIRQKSMEENFVTIVNYFQTIIGLPDKVRRLSIQLGGAKGANNISDNMRISQVRSLIFCGFFKSVPSITEYGLLQVLILHIWSDEERCFDLTTIGELYRLRYLKIECSITVKLPQKIRKLQQLGTLQVDSRLYAVPSDIVYLDKLLHLQLGLRSESIMPHGFGRMTCLRTLGYFDIGSNSEDNVRDLGELRDLQDLQLTCSAVQPAETLEKNVQLLLGTVLKKLSTLHSVTLVPAAGSSNVNTPHDGAEGSSMIISCDGSSIVFHAQARLQRLTLSRRCCIFSRLPKWIGELHDLCILKIAVKELSKEDIDILKGMPALTALSLYVQPMSADRIVFGREGFSVLTNFKLMCNVPWLKFESDAMPNLEKLKLYFNSPIVDEHGNTRIIIIERLLGLKDISAIIGSAGVDAGSAWQKVITNDPGNPKLQLMGSIYFGDQDRGMVTPERSGKYENNEADIRVHMPLECLHLPVPAHYREVEPEDQPFIWEIINIPRESERTEGHSGLGVFEEERDGSKQNLRSLQEGVLVSPATGAMKAVLRNLATLVGGEYKPLKGVRKEIEALTCELAAMDAFLQKKSEEKDPDVQDKFWMNEVRELSYVVEDSIDALIQCIEDKDTNPDGLIKNIKNLLGKMKAHRRVGNEFEDLKKQIIEVGGRNKRYNAAVFGNSKSLPSLDEFKYLRVLDFEGCNQLENHHVANIENLFLLMYLNLRKTRVSELPKQIGSLQFLEMLDLRPNKSELPQVPNLLGFLVNLRELHLEVKGNRHGDLCMLGALPALVILTLRVAGKAENRLIFSAGVGFLCLRHLCYCRAQLGGMDLMFAEGSMPKLEKLEIEFNAAESDSLSGDAFDFGIENLGCLTSLTCRVHGCVDSAVTAAKEYLERATRTHPNHPTLLLELTYGAAI